MRRTLTVLIITLALALFVALVGCNKQDTPEPAPAPEPTPAPVPTEKTIVVPAGVTLDLNGQTLTVGSAASFGVIMGEGKLIVDEYGLALSGNGKYMPVYENDGYVFKQVDLRTWGTGFTGDKYRVQFANYATSDDYFCDILAQSGNELNVIVRATWESGFGTSVQDFVLGDELDAKYAEFKGQGPYMVFDITGLEAMADTLNVSVIYQMNVGNFVVEIAN